MRRVIGYRWHLRLRMAERGMFATTDLVPLLAERGVALSREQVYRLVAGTPERLSLQTMAALCDILECAPGDLVEPVVEAKRASRRAAGDRSATTVPRELRPKRARIVPEPAQDR
ncbi:MAG: helix-turn-helix domain-containing protein [Nitriliruptorales bacterium]|nr:helix-turn-helix domain-containing protein [Nitriliruptorales bacterium]